MEADRVTEQIKNTCFTITRWKGENEFGAKVILFPDFNDHSGRFRNALPSINAIGSEVITVDYCNGRDGTSTKVLSIEEYQANLVSFQEEEILETESVTIIGVGFGCSLASSLAGLLDSRCSDLVLVNPIFDLNKVLPGGIQQIARYVTAMSGNPTMMTWESRLVTTDKDLLNQLDTDPKFIQESVSLSSVKNIKELGSQMGVNLLKIRSRLLMVCSEKSRLSDSEKAFEVYSATNAIEKHMLLIPSGEHYAIFSENADEIWADIHNWILAGTGDNTFFEAHQR